jgi:hypothetical protein
MFAVFQTQKQYSFDLLPASLTNQPHLVIDPDYARRVSIAGLEDSDDEEPSSSDSSTAAAAAELYADFEEEGGEDEEEVAPTAPAAASTRARQAPSIVRGLLTALVTASYEVPGEELEKLIPALQQMQAGFQPYLQRAGLDSADSDATRRSGGQQQQPATGQQKRRQQQQPAPGPPQPVAAPLQEQPANRQQAQAGREAGREQPAELPEFTKIRGPGRPKKPSSEQHAFPLRVSVCNLTPPRSLQVASQKLHLQRLTGEKLAPKKKVPTRKLPVRACNR